MGAVDGLLQLQAPADLEYLRSICRGRYDAAQIQQLRTDLLRGVFTALAPLVG